MDPNGKQEYVLVDTPGKIRTLRILKYFLVALLLALSTYAFLYELKGIEKVKSLLSSGKAKEAKSKPKPQKPQKSKKPSNDGE